MGCGGGVVVVEVAAVGGVHVLVANLRTAIEGAIEVDLVDEVPKLLIVRLVLFVNGRERRADASTIDDTIQRLELRHSGLDGFMARLLLCHIQFYEQGPRSKLLLCLLSLLRFLVTDRNVSTLRDQELGLAMSPCARTYGTLACWGSLEEPQHC